MVHLVAFITTKPGLRDALLAEFHKLIPLVHAESGCIEYQPVVDIEGFDGVTTPLGPDTYAVIEKWATPDALRAHSAAPHMAAFGKVAKDMIAKRVLHILKEG
jgi:quinol monooxygenase YgiN